MTKIGGYRLDVVRTQLELKSLAAEWEQIHRATSYQNPFLSYKWTLACLKHLPECRSPFFLTARAGDQLAGVAPLRLERQLGFRVLRFAGDGRSDYLGFLCSPDHSEMERVLLEGLAAKRADWDLAVLRHLPPDFGRVSSVSLPPSLW